MANSSPTAAPKRPGRWRWLKRTLLGIGLVVLLFIGTVGTLMYQARSGLKPLVDGQALTGGSITIKDDYTSAYLLPAGTGRYALIDCGMDANGTAILSRLRKLGSGPDAVEAIFVTHAHPDHVGACHLFKQATVYAFPGVGPVVSGNATTHGPLPRFIGTPAKSRFIVGHDLTDGEVVRVGDLSVTALKVPGHTDADGVYAANGTLYGGDAFAIRDDGTVRSPVWLFADSTDEARASLAGLAKRLNGMKPQIVQVANAHSGAVTGIQPLRDFAATNTK